MRYFLILLIGILTLALVLQGVNPWSKLKKSDKTDISTSVLFKKATGNINRLRSTLENCTKSTSENNKDNEITAEKEDKLSPEQKLINELEIILAYQNKVIAEYKYEETLAKSVQRTASPADVQKAYQELESANLYLSRLLENYPEGTNLLH